jgi:hypothetical protein
MVPGIAISDLGSFSIVGRSRTLMYVAGGEEWTISTLTREHPASLDFRSRPMRRSTSLLGAILSPDGRFVDVWSQPLGSSRLQAGIVPFDGGPEITIPPSGGKWVDVAWSWSSSHLLYLSQDPNEKLTLYSFGVASRRARAVGPIPPSARGSLQAVGPDMLAWVDDSAFSIVLADTNGVELRRLADPDRSERAGLVIASPDGRNLFTSRWSVGFDSLLYTTIDLETGRRKRLGGLPVEEPGGIFWEPGGSLQISVMETLGTLAFYRIDKNAGRPVRLASFPAEGLLYYSFSRDGRRAVKVERKPRGDVWMVSNFDGREAR